MAKRTKRPRKSAEEKDAQARDDAQVQHEVESVVEDRQPETLQNQIESPGPGAVASEGIDPTVGMSDKELDQWHNEKVSFKSLDPKNIIDGEFTDVDKPIKMTRAQAREQTDRGVRLEEIKEKGQRASR